MAIGDLVKKLREKKGWTLDELAEKSGISRRHLQSIEYHNRHNLTLRTIRRLAQAFGVKVEKFL